MRFSPLFLASVPFAALLAAACGGTVSGTGGSGAGTTGTGAGTTTTGTGGSISPAGCPSTAPTAGASCTHAGAQCSYGNSTYAECRESFTCQGGTWAALASSCPQMSASCPASPPKDQSSCDLDAGYATCGYPDGEICVCSSCPPIGGACMPMPLTWFCSGPPATSGCPKLIPNQGTSCSTPALSCSYPSGSCGVGAVCMAGAWVWQQFGCPG